MRVAPRRAATIEMPARIDGSAGDEIENAFLILRATASRRRWRILARFTVRLIADRLPAVEVKAVDVHPAGR